MMSVAPFFNAFGETVPWMRIFSPAWKVARKIVLLDRVPPGPTMGTGKSAFANPGFDATRAW